LWTLQDPATPIEKWLDNSFDFFWAAAAAPSKTKK
jgi:hypothetical protein